MIVQVLLKQLPETVAGISQIESGIVMGSEHKPVAIINAARDENKDFLPMTVVLESGQMKELSSIR